MRLERSAQSTSTSSVRRASKMGATSKILVVVVGLLMAGVAVQAIYTAENSGPVVTRAAINELVNSGCFASKGDQWPDFLFCLAAVESSYGTHQATFRNLPVPFHGGIWQVDLTMLGETQGRTDQAFLDKYQCILNFFNDPNGPVDGVTGPPPPGPIDWNMVVWNELRKPMYSALAAMLYLCATAPIVPSGQVAQCNYWETHWNREQATDVIVQNGNRNEVYWLRETRFKDDPHMEQLIPGSKTPLCYDIIGGQDDIYRLYTNDERNIKVNCVLTGIRKGDKGIYIGEVVVMVGETLVQVTVGSIAYNGGPKGLWMVQTWRDENNLATIVVEPRRVVINFLFTEIRIVKNRRWLDVELSHLQSFGPTDGGVFGFIQNHVHIEEHNLGANLIVTDEAQNTTTVHSLHSKPHHCWRIFKRGHDEFSQFLKTQHIIKCPTC